MNFRSWACYVLDAASHSLQCSHLDFRVISKEDNCHSHFTANKTGNETLQVGGYNTCTQTYVKSGFRIFIFFYQFIDISCLHDFIL